MQATLSIMAKQFSIDFFSELEYDKDVGERYISFPMKGGFDMWSKSAEILNPYEEILGEDTQTETVAQEDSLVQQPDSK